MAGKLVKKTELCAIMGVQLKTLTIWQEEGMPYEKAEVSGAKNAYNTKDVIDWRIRRESSKSGLDLEDEKAKLTALQSETAELKNARLSGTSIDLEAAIAVAQRAAFAIRQRIIALPLPQSQIKAILAEIHGLGETDFSKSEEGADEDDETDEGTAVKAKSG